MLKSKDINKIAELKHGFTPGSTLHLKFSSNTSLVISMTWNYLSFGMHIVLERRWTP